MEMPPKIRFGTDGWRAVFAQDFTFENVGRLSQAIADYLRSPQRQELDIYKEWGVEYRAAEQGVIIGYDTRFMSKDFAIQVGRVLQSNDIPVQISAEPAPSPALSFAVKNLKAACGIMITASHNPPEYNGIKIKAEFAGSAPPQYTKQIENLLQEDFRLQAEAEELQLVDLKTPYLAKIKELIEKEALKGAPLRVVIDSMYGSARGYMADVLQELDIPYVQIRGEDDPYFGGKNPEPLAKNLTPLKAVIGAERTRKKSEEILVGVATDGDGDRVAAMDELGNLIDAHRCYALILRHLLARGWRGKAIKSFALSDMANKIAQKSGIEVEEVPIGFKYICERFLKEDVLIGGEESGGIGIKNYIPERDGILMALLLLEIAATKKKPMSLIVDEMMQEIGYHYYDRKDLPLEERIEIMEKLKKRPPLQFAGRPVLKVEDLDGIKLRFAEGWLLFRASGTEPLLRLYCEMDNINKVHQVLGEAEQYARGELKLL